MTAGVIRIKLIYLICRNSAAVAFYFY